MSNLRCFVNCFVRGHRYFYTGRELMKNPLDRRILPSLQNDLTVRYYAKGKDKKKEDKGKGHKKKIEINELALAENINYDKMKTEMELSIERMKDSFAKHVSLRTTTGAIETLTITYEGKKYPLMEVAQIMRNNPKTIVLNLSSFPQVIPAVLKSLSQSGMNLNPQQDGTTIFLPVPRVTKEHRETLVKNAKALFIKCRDSIKDTNLKNIKLLKSKEKEGLSEDLSNQLIEQVKHIADDYIHQAEQLFEKKQNELLGN
ncbi:ribosome-recycling factor, mitochondrial [Cimex lectularius]|uniref:Ribosome-recycling factor, mitochondrial n=1 Tax=Cimex lectularius TaxID=79782 RepID=A0A8I6RGH9_CIMLE|nr:ribosome-recycling factor, mitochondrial [Cimex lectularius]